MTKEVPAFLRAEIGNDAADPTQEPQNRMLSRFAQMRLEFAEGQLDRVEVRRILRKIRLCSNMTGICSRSKPTWIFTIAKRVKLALTVKAVRERWLPVQVTGAAMHKISAGLVSNS